MRILFWSEAFEPRIGGAEILATKLVSALQERGHELAVITRSDSDDLPEEARYGDIPVYRYPFWTALGEQDVDQVVRLRQQVARVKQAFRPDLVHLYYGGIDAMLHQLTVRAHPAPVLVTLHSLTGDQFVRPGTVLGSILRSAVWVAACSAMVLAGTRRQVPKITSRSSVIRNGLEWPAARPDPLPFAAPRLLCLGRVVPKKGFDLALTAFATLVDRFPAARLVIAGDGTSRSRLQEQARHLGVADAVDFVGWLAPNDVPRVINASTLVIMPSRHEGFGLVALQAAQLSRPVVATRVGGLPEVVVHGQTGLLVEQESPRAIADAVAFLLEHPAGARRMGEAARSRAREVFGWERYVDSYNALYRSIVGTALARG